MTFTELNKYVKKARKEHLTDADIKRDLRTAGWLDRDIDAALRDNPLIKPPAPPENYHGIASGGLAAVSSPTMWDAFEHVLMFISLYVLAISLALTFHLFINRWVPGIPEGYRMNPNADVSELRGYMAALIVSFPLFSFFFLRITGRTLKNPLIRALGARKFLIYATLVVTFIIVTGSIISIIYNFLNGNVNMNFFLHFVVTTAISSIVFAYYLQQVKEDRTYA
jgi:hypothetical protein